MIRFLHNFPTSYCQLLKSGLCASMLLMLTHVPAHALDPLVPGNISIKPSVPNANWNPSRELYPGESVALQVSVTSSENLNDKEYKLVEGSTTIELPQQDSLWTRTHGQNGDTNFTFQVLNSGGDPTQSTVKLKANWLATSRSSGGSAGGNSTDSIEGLAIGTAYSERPVFTWEFDPRMQFADGYSVIKFTLTAAANGASISLTDYNVTNDYGWTIQPEPVSADGALTGTIKSSSPGKGVLKVMYNGKEQGRSPKEIAFAKLDLQIASFGNGEFLAEDRVSENGQPPATPHEMNPGSIVIAPIKGSNTSGKRAKLKLSGNGGSSNDGTYELDKQNLPKVKIYTDATEGELINLPKTWSAEEFGQEKILYVGSDEDEPANAVEDGTLILTYERTLSNNPEQSSENNSVKAEIEDKVKVRLLPVDLAVDADRDGEITFDGNDKTTAEKPFRFWINDDDDTFGEGNDAGGTLDRIPAVTPDHQNNFIDFIRDLEDFSRIAFKLPDSLWSQIKAGEIQVGFKWSDTSDGTPAVNIFRQSDQSGGQVQYFVNEDEAFNQAATFANAAQKVMTVSGSGTAYFPQSFIDRLPTTSAPTYVLFEGAAKGKGKLNLVLKINGQEVVCDGPWIKLMDVRQFYTRGRTDYTANVISDPWDNPNPHVIASVPDNTPEFVVDPDETQQCIIHVHGWRMTEGDSRNWSEMTFKRLWQLHYKGRFATFRWATFSEDTHPNTSLLTYNRSEYRSWLCGPALAQFVNGLPYPGSRYLVAHSMGNVISGKALQAGMNVNRYVMCNAAMAAMSYDPSITNLPLSASSTPDTDSDPATAAFGLKNRFNDNLTTRINYYLPDDDALQSWIANQIVNKPELFLTSAYVYDPFDTPGNKIYYSDGVVLPSRRNVASLAEAMGHAVKSRSNAVGAVGYANGCISSKVGMDGFGFGDEHSAEWNWSLTGSYKFWRKLFVSFQIPTTAPQ